MPGGVFRAGVRGKGVYVPGTASFLAYGVDGQLVGAQGYPDDFYPGLLFAQAGNSLPVDTRKRATPPQGVGLKLGSPK